MKIANDLPHRLDRTAERVRKVTGVSLAFAGSVTSANDLVLGNFAGPTVGALPGVVLRYGEGLGGRAVASRRPIAVNDYFSCDQITHRYDLIIRAEGIRSIAAVPVVIDRRPIALVYAAFRTDEIVGDRIQDGLKDEARALEQELVTLHALRGSQEEKDADLGSLRERVREAYTELRTLGRRVSDPAVERALHDIARRLTEPGTDTRPLDNLTRRELDVLALASSGLSNKTIADRLGLTSQTVKSYMKSAMSKLHATTRLEAVVIARRAGLLP
ncbi:LuxR C-terminal-related transcriptional regulator [Streptomyces sp. NY05-11A]|uniref:LuxR C-terminal-related transcriptional regulator n=1 Tax=Streptomyces soliscabiei TaxID=588897 RepID=UPI0029BC2A74|nr:LuxR C-terminal-related transcriptional regulator [Streptomyces sp. NY05-11A]MDX2682201.1 LuxR C-terminal-related transcriptional regulator [Streptomyces sp. NY05-11A]